MKVIITQPEIQQILSAHVLENFSLKDGSVPNITFTATRGSDGVTAEIDIPYMGVEALDLATKSETATPRNKKSSKEIFTGGNKPKTPEPAKKEEEPAAQEAETVDEPEATPADTKATGTSLFDS